GATDLYPRAIPESPEIQALAERIAVPLAGAAFVRADPLSFSGLKTVTPPPQDLAGKRLDAVGRRGKFLVFGFQDGHRLLVHLSQGGRIDLEAGGGSS